MPLSLSKLVNNRALVAVDFGGGDVLNVEYYPAKLTGQMLADMNSMSLIAEMAPAAQNQAITASTAVLTTLLASWDFIDEDGEPLPLDAEHIAALGFGIQWTILGAITANNAGRKPGEAPAAQPA